MQSQGSTSSQPSFDSLSSSDSLLFSDSEQAEDDTDVFLTDSSPSVIIGGSGGASASGNGGSDSPGSQWTCDGFTDKEEEEDSYRSQSGGKAAHVSLGKTDPARQTAKSQGDLLFAQKCAELQGFIRPLLELLNGLKRGRFDRGLSSFQQSVAMDRIQRIVGVLQRPDCGEKYLNTLLQVEMMLKLWFPQILTQPVSTASSVATSPARSLQEAFGSTPPHKHRDQLHIPVKKRRLSWTGTDSPTPSPIPLKSPHISTGENRVKSDCREGGPSSSPSLAADANQSLAHAASSSQLTDDKNDGKDGDGKEPVKVSKYQAGQSSKPSLTWVHVAPILSPRNTCLSHDALTASRRLSPATQDSSISSTTPYKHPKNVKKPIRCQSQPVAGQQSERGTTEATPGESQSPPVTLKPLPGACPTSLKT
ncbi:circadian-associated transcriptional repressor-like [Pundamilia nyererei]|uniref:Circadian-associated transcriptional repressor-like n=1 Tax=Pundamilia nyererei TaxID=303518 RepID=A0A9Y3VJ73_9CICH|nr:PREDICTED: circadian-associated transcriptional repressor-like [Pundamilia nyererei]